MTTLPRGDTPLHRNPRAGDHQWPRRPGFAALTVPVLPPSLLMNMGTATAFAGTVVWFSAVDGQGR